jgi:hypothetical protein
LWRIRGTQEKFSGAKLSVIAHSFGTYAIANILKENPDIQLHRLILCGAIVPSEFRWDQIQHRVETEIINDCGISDVWPVLAQSTTFGYGASGRFGFGTPGVRDRYHDFGHGGFFEKQFVRDFWLPWFRNGEFVDSKAPPRAAAHWHLLTIFQLKWAAILVLLLGMLTPLQRCSDSLSRIWANVQEAVRYLSRTSEVKADEVKIGDELFLRDGDGNYVIAAYTFNNYWPQVGKMPKETLTLLGSGQLQHGSTVGIQSLEQKLNPKNVLFADIPACHYEKRGSDDERQEWKILKVHPSDPVLHYGEPIYLENVHYRGKRLSEDFPRQDLNRIGEDQPFGNYLTVDDGEDRWWILEKN